MKTISLYQPWASAMAFGLKKIETRGTRIHHRGRCAIHAGKKWDEELESCALDLSLEVGDARLRDDLPRGVVIAVGTIINCIPAEILEQEITRTEALLGNYRRGRWGWVFTDIVALETPFEWRGQQGQWDIPDIEFTSRGIEL